MKTNVGTLVIVDMHADFGARLQLSAVGQFVALDVSPHDVIGLAGGHALREFAVVIGIKLPAGFFLVGQADLYLDSIERLSTWIPNRAEDQRVRGRLLALVGA